MALYGVSIEKETLFHGQAERFSNQYYYEVGAGAENADFISLIDQITAAEKKVHSPEVTWKLGRLWSAGGTKEQNTQLVLKDLFGQGELPTIQRMAAEAAILIEWEASRKDIRGRKVYLRKFIRSQHLGQSDDNAAAQRTQIQATARAAFKAYADDVEGFTLGIDLLAALTTKGGNFPLRTGNGAVDPFVRTREFRRN